MMLYNPLTHEGMTTWLQKQPADETYIFHDTRWCPVGQYMASLGRYNYDYSETVIKIFGSELDALRILCAHPRTFGSLLERAAP